MHSFVTETTKALLMSAAMQTEIDAYNAPLNAGFQVNARDCLDQTVVLLVQHPLAIKPFTRVYVSDPPVAPGGGYPVAYVYHLTTEYPKESQEAAIKLGMHRIGITIFDTGSTNDDAEASAGRLGSCVTKLIEHNQYIYGSLPGAKGASTVMFVENEISGQHQASTNVPFHLIFVARIWEVR